jgi:hypothetical protein
LADTIEYGEGRAIDGARTGGGERSSNHVDVEEGDLAIVLKHQQHPEANQMAAFPARERDAFVAH